MRGLPVALVALLALTGLAAAAGPSGFRGVFSSWRRGRGLLEDPVLTSDVTFEGVTSGSNSIGLIVKQRSPFTPLRYGLYTFNSATNSWNSKVNLVGETRTASTEQPQGDATLKVYQVTLSSISTMTGFNATGYYRLYAGYLIGTDWFASATVGPGVAVGMPGAISVSAANVPSSNKLRITMTQGLQNTAGAYRYKVYKFGTDHTVSSNVEYTSGRVEITPWVNATTDFDTPDLSPGLYSVWVQAEHKDYSDSDSDTSSLFTTATSPAGTSYAIGTANQPVIVQADEPVAATLSNKFVVWFKYPDVNNVQQIGYTLDDVNSPGSTAVATCGASECTKVGTSKYLANVVPADSGAPSGATHKLETGTAVKGLYKIKLWGINAVTTEGTASAPSAAVATFDTPGTPSSVYSVQSADQSNTLTVQFSRTVEKIGSAYYFDVKDAAGNFAQYGSPPADMRDLPATIADVSLDTLQFATPVILGGSKRYRVVVHACTGKGTKCSGDADSNLAGVGQPSAPQNVAIAAGMTKLTVTWDSPTTDTASNYTVRLYSDAGDSTFTAASVANWPNMPWNNNPAETGLVYVEQPTSGQPRYTYTTSALTPGIATGYYRAEVLAQHPRYQSVPANSGTSNTAPQRAALGNPGALAVVNSEYQGALRRIEVTFSEATPQTAERYAVTVYSRATTGGSNVLIATWSEVPWTATVSGSNKKLTISTADNSSPAWPGPGRYVFVVHAGNAAGGDTGYNVASEVSSELRVGPPGRPDTTATDTNVSPVEIELVTGTPDLADSYGVEVYGYKYKENTCGDIIDSFDFPTNLDGALVQFTQAGATNATYCLMGVAYFYGGTYSQTSPTIVHLGLPTQPSQPTLISGRMKMDVTFPCPAIWNSRFMTFELKRVDKSVNTIVLSSDPTAANASPSLVRGTAGSGEWKITETWVASTGTCSFSVTTEDLPGTDSDAGQYQIKLVAHNGVGTRESLASANAWIGEPATPTNVAVHNSETVATTLQLSVDVPPSDVHGGYALQLDWLHAGETDAVQFNGGSTIYTPRTSVTDHPTDNTKWLVSFDLSKMTCGSGSCGDGRYKITYFAALSRFTPGGAFIDVPQYESQTGNYQEGYQKVASLFPTTDIYIGNPTAPTGLTILDDPRRIYDPTTNTLDLQIDVPEADVAKEYAYELYYYSVQKYDAGAVVGVGSFTRDSLTPVDEGGVNVFKLAIDLTKLDCNTATAGIQACASTFAGSYRLKSFTAVTRVAGAGKADAPVADLSGLTAGGDIIVEETGGTLEPAKHVHIPNVQLAATAGDTIVYIEVDALAGDNLMGWSYELQYWHGTTRTAQDVQDSSQNKRLYVSRLDASVNESGTRLRIPLKKLGSLECDYGAGFTACTAGGRFSLKSLTAYSWFDDAGAAVLESSYTSAHNDAGFTVLQDLLGSPRTAGTNWDMEFFVGAPVAPIGIREPGVLSSSSPLDIYITPPAADNAYSYSVTLERLPDGATAAGSGTSITVEVYRGAVTLISNEYQLSILAADVGAALAAAGASGVVAGRYRLTGLAATPWSDVTGASAAPATFTAIPFVIGEPAGPSTVKVTNSPSLDTSIKIQMDEPSGDVHGGFVLQLKWLHAGQETTVQSNVPADGDTIFVPYSDAVRGTPGNGKWQIPFALSSMTCGSADCAEGRYEIVKFGTLSLFDDAGALVGTGSYKTGKKVWAPSPPTGSIFYGNPLEPQALSIVDRRIYDPTARTLDLQISIPERDVAKEYRVELHYYAIQDDDSSRVDLEKTISRFPVVPLAESGGKLTIPIDLSSLDCPSDKKCGAGSYRLKSFTAVSRVTGAGKADASVADLSGLTAGGDIIVEDLDGTPAAPLTVFIPNQPYAVSDRADTLISIEMDVPDKDNIMGWEYELEFEPGQGTNMFTKTAVKDSTGATTTLFTPRLSANASNGRLAFQVRMGDLRCDYGNDNYGDCPGGKFSLKSIKALSWFAKTTHAGISTAASSSAATRDTADSNSAYTKKTVIFGSPLADAASEWDAVFYVGAPDRPVIDSLPNVTLTTSPLIFYLEAQTEDNVYSYQVFLERLPAGAVDGAGTAISLELYRGSSAISKDPGDINGDRLRLSITSAELDAKLRAAGVTGTDVVVGRYRLYGFKAASWFDPPNPVDTYTDLPAYIIIGSPSDSTLVLNAAPSIRTGTTVEVSIDKPDADVAKFYTVDVEYHSGKAAVKTLEAAITCSTTFKQLLGSTAPAAGAAFAVRCPTGCLAETAAKVYTDDPGSRYLYTSSICRAFIHADLTIPSSGQLMVLLVAGLQLDQRSFKEDTFNDVTPSTPVGLTEPDNWDFKFLGTDPLPASTTTFVVPRWGGARVSGNNLVLPIDLSQATCQGSTACAAGKFLVKSVTAHPHHNSGYTGYVQGVSGTNSAGPRPTFTFLGDPEVPTGVVADNSDATVDSFTISFDRPEADTALNYYVEVNKYFPGSSTSAAQKCSGTFDMPGATADAEGYTDSGTTRTIVLSNAMMGDSCSLAPGKFRVTTFKAVSRFNDQTNNYDQPATDETLKIGAHISVDSYFYVGPVDVVTDVISPHITEAASASINSLVVDWNQTSPDAARTASYQLFRQPVGASSATEVCSKTDLSQGDLDAVTYKAGSAQPLTLTVGLCTAGLLLPKGRYQIEWTVNGQPNANSKSYTSPFFYVGDTTPPGKPALTNDIASSPKRLFVEFDTPTTDNAESYKYDLVKVRDGFVTVPDAATTSDTAAGYEFVSDHTNQALPSNKVLGTSSNTFYLEGLAKGLYKVRVTSVNPNKDGALSLWSDVVGTDNPEVPVISSVPSVESGTTLSVKLVPPTDDTALFYTVDVAYYSGQQSTPKPLTTFTVMRFGTSGSYASFEGTGDDRKLVLPVDLSQVDCRTGGTTEQNKCGDGKYLVTQVKAHRWVNGGSSSSDASGVATSDAWTTFTFVGHPVAPTALSADNSDTATGTVTLRFARPDVDTAKEYAVVLTKYYPGGAAIAQMCSGKFSMPTTTAGTAPTVDNSDKRVISVTGLEPAAECGTLLGKFRVTELKAVSWFTDDTHDHDAPADATTLNSGSVASYFYIGPVGALSYVSSPNMPITAATPSTLTSLTVHWEHSTVQDGHPAKQAQYTLKRYYNGDTSGEEICIDEPITASQLDSTAFKSGSTARLELAVTMCTTVAKGRYKLTWDVIGNPSSNTQSYTSDDFFFIGDPVAPGAAPEVTNDEVNNQLVVRFDTPAIDNAGGYKYDLVKVDSPSVTVPDDATTDGTGYSFVSAHKDKDLPDGASLDTDYNSFALTALPGALYRVRVKSVNPNGVAISAWSAAIGTGTPVAPVISAGADGVANVAEGSTTLVVKLDRPTADVALYYTVEVDYYSGKDVTPNPKMLAGPLQGTTLLDCATTGDAVPGLTHAAGNSLAVRCPANCAGQAGPVYNDGAYLSASSVCRAAIHKGILGETDGGAFRVTLKAGADPRGTLPAEESNSVTPVEYTGDALTPATNLDLVFEPLPTGADAFTVMRWGGANSFVQVEGTAPDEKLVLTIDLSQADCRTGGSAAENKCGNGKYVVRQVKAFSWYTGGNYLAKNTDVGTPMASNRALYTFVGDPAAPTNVAGVSADLSGPSLKFTLDRPEADTAKEYTVVVKQYFPGDDDAVTCSKTFSMPLDGTSSDIVDAGATRTITVRDLDGTGCSTLRGKYRVFSLTATSWHTGGTNGVFDQATFTTATYFYIGPVGAVSYVSSPNMPIAAATPSTLTSLTVHWEHATVQDGYPAKLAQYTLKKYLTGDTTTGSEVCTDEPITAAQLDGTAFESGSTTRLELAVAMCGSATVAKGRYKLTWAVSGNPASNTQTYTSDDFFFIGDPISPGKPTLTNDIVTSPKRLTVQFTTPTTDNAGGYKYDLVEVANPAITVPDDATPAMGSATTYTFVSGHSNQDLPGDASLGASANTFHLSNLADKLYRVRVTSVNPNGQAASVWSDIIGTGPISSKSTDSVTVVDGEDRLTVSFNLVAGALGYRYTIFTEDSSTNVLANHENVVIESPAITSVTWDGSTAATFEIVDKPGAELPAGRYTVAIAPKNTDATGAVQWGAYTHATTRAAVGTPGPPTAIGLANTPDGTGLKVGSVTVTYTAPSPDSGLEYWYAIYKADISADTQCYTTLGTKVATSTALLTATTKTFELTSLQSGDYQVRVGVKNGLTTGDSSVVAKLCDDLSTTSTLDKDVIWSDLSNAIVAVDNPDQPGKPSVEYIHGQNKLTVTFQAPATGRSYTYKVVDATRADEVQVDVGTPVPINAERPSEPVTFDILTSTPSAWKPGLYKITVYVQNAFASTGIGSPASDGTYVGTPDPVTAVKLENTATDGTITVLYTPPAVDIAQDSAAGSYRYTVMARDSNCDWQDLSGNTAVDIGKPSYVSGSTTQRTFEIAGLAAGLYQVKVWGLIVHPNGKDGSNQPQTIEEPSTETTSAGDHSDASKTYMRSGTIAVGTPGVPQVSLTGAVDGMTIQFNSITGNDNALSYKWVYLKDEDTANADVGSQLAKAIPLTAATQTSAWMGFIDPLVVEGRYPVSYKVPLNEALCGDNRDAACQEGTYRVGVIAVNGFGESAYALTTVADSSIMGLPATPTVTSLVVAENTMETLDAKWQISNKWTALSYRFDLRNDVGTDTYGSPLTAASASNTDQSFSQDVSPMAGGSYTGSGVYYLTVTAENDNGQSTSVEFPDTGRVVGIPIAGGALGLRSVQVADPTTRQLTLSFKDGWNSWTEVEGSCETTYEWEVLRSPGLSLVASSSQTIDPCSPPSGVLCAGTGAARGCSNIITGVAGSGLPDGRYQVVVVAYNQYGYKRSATSNIVTVGAPSSTPLVLTPRDGSSQVSVTFATPARPGSYECQATGADGTTWSPTVTKTLSQVSVSDDGATTRIDITSTDVPALGTKQQRWAVQCKPINSFSASVDWSAAVVAASGAPTAVSPAPTLSLPSSGNGVKFGFTPASPDAAMRYVFILEAQNGTVWESPAVAFDSNELEPGSGGAKEYTWTTTPSGQFTGKVRSINGVGNTTSAASAALAVGLPGQPGTPEAQNGQASFVVSFNPGTPSTATAFYFNIYTEDGTTPVNTGGKLLAPTPTTPSGGYDYSGMTPADLLSFDTGNLATLAGVNLLAGVYRITVFAYNGNAPTELQYSPESAKSNLVSLGKPGIPTGLTVSPGLRKLKAAFTPPSPDAAVYYEYTVRDASRVNVPGATRIRVERSALTQDAGKLSFETVDLNTYQLYSVRLTAVGYGSVFSSWSANALAGMPSPAPSGVTLTPGQTSLKVTFTAPALLAATDTFAYKLYTLGATPQPVGDANGYVVPRVNITGDLSTSGSKSFDIQLDTAATPAYDVLKAPAGGYYVEVLPARVLASGSPPPQELGAPSAQAGPATLGAPQTPAIKPDVTSVTYSADPQATVQWAYDTYSTYTKVEWRINKASDGTEVASGNRDVSRDTATAISSPLSETISLKYTSGVYQGTTLRGRYTVEVRMASAQGTSDWSPPSDAFAAGAPSEPATVTITNDPAKTPSLSGTFTLPADPCYDTLSYRLVNVNQDGSDGTPVLGANVWKALAAGDITENAGTFTFDIPDSISVGGGSSVAVASPGRYRLDMRATTNNGAAPADYIGSAVSPTPQTPAYKGVPVAATAVSSTSGVAAITLSFQGAEFATSYRVHVLDNSDAVKQTATMPDTISGTGSKSYSLDAVTLGSPPAGGATYKLKVESRNPNSPATGALSSASSLVIYGKLAKPDAPELVWVPLAGSDPAHAELRFAAITAPSGADPTYEYQLYDATQSPPTAVGGWQAIDLSQATGDGSAGDKYKVRLAPSPGKYTATLRAKTALGDSATSDESEPSAEEVTGVTSQPGILAVGSGDSTIVTEDSGATTVVLLITLPTSNTGSTKPQLQMRMDTAEPTPAAQGSWANVADSCTGSPALCIDGGAGTSQSPLQVKLTLSATDLPSPRRVSFVARTENDNGPGAESSPSNAISVGRPKPPTVTAVGSATGVEVTFTPDTLLTGDTFKYWAVDASAGSSSETRLVEAEVSSWTAGTGAQRKFTVPFADFEGTNVPYIVTLQMAAVNANAKRSIHGSSATAVTVGPVTAPTGVSAAAAVISNTATVAVSYTPGDTTGIADRYRIKAYPESSRLVVLTFDAATATSTTAQQSTTLTVGGSVGELPPGRWRFAVVAENANSQAESAAYPTSDWVSAGIPGAPIITGVDGTADSGATISFTTAADNTADRVRVYYADGSLPWTALSTLFNVDRSQAVKTASVAMGGSDGLPRSGNWRFKLEAVNNAGGSPSYTASPQSNAWPATTVGLPGAPTINSVGGVVGSLSTITLTLKQAADKTATAFVLRVHDASGSLISDYSAPLLSIGAPDGSGWQKVVFATDQSASRLGGSYKFKVAAINSLGTGEDSDLTATATAAYKPAAPEQLVATKGTSQATLTFAPAAGAVSYEAAILPASGDWRVPTDALQLYAPASVQQIDEGGTAKLTFEVPLAAFAYRDGQYKFQVRGVDANGVRGDWSAESGAVTVGAPDAPTGLAVTSKLGSSAVDLSFVPAWLAEQGYQIEVLDKDGNAVLDTLTVQASSCSAKASSPQ